LQLNYIKINLYIIANYKLVISKESIINLITEFIEALNDVESFDLIKILIEFFSSSIAILDLYSGIVSNSNKIEL